MTPDTTAPPPPHDCVLCIVNGSGNATYLAIRTDVHPAWSYRGGGSSSSSGSPGGEHTCSLVEIHGEEYIMYPVKYLLCPICAEKKWFVCPGVLQIFERECRCREPDDMPPVLGRMHDALQAVSGRAPCERHGIRVDPRSGVVERVTRYLAVCTCPPTGGPPGDPGSGDVEQSADFMMNVMRVMREDYTRIMTDRAEPGQ